MAADEHVPVVEIIKLKKQIRNIAEFSIKQRKGRFSDLQQEELCPQQGICRQLRAVLKRVTARRVTKLRSQIREHETSGRRYN